MNKFNLPFLGLIFFLITHSVSGQKIFLKADDLTNGASTIDRYSDYAEISSLQFGGSSTMSLTQGTGGGVGKSDFREIIITKNVDISSNKFLDKMAKGQFISLIEIVSTINSGGPKVVHKIELKDAYVTNISSSTVQGCTGNCPAIAESYSFKYRAIRITTFSVNSNGSVVANPDPFVFNVVTNTSTF